MPALAHALRTRSNSGSAVTRRSRTSRTQQSGNPLNQHLHPSSGGRPLDSGARQFFNSRFGYDFSGVRVHTDDRAAVSAQAVNAAAYNVGRAIVFGDAQFQPGTAAGRWLIAHELAHVVQREQRRVPNNRVQRRFRGDEDPIHRPLIEDWRREHGLPESGVDESGQRVGPSDAEIKYQLRTPRPRPAAANVQDPRERVRPADRANVNQMATFLSATIAQIRTLLAAANPAEPWMTAQNPHLQSLLTLLDRLLADLQQDRLIIRFDQPAAGATVARYETLGDTMHLRPFADAAGRNLTVASMVHEYAHVLQDRALEDLLSRSQGPLEHTRDDELGQEIESRRHEVYFTRLVRQLGISIGSGQAAFDAELNARVMTLRFEQERTGTATQRRTATQQIRSAIEGPYAASGQLDANSPMRMYPIRIESNNHATLMTTQGAVDLGAVPAAVQNQTQMITHLESAVRALPNFNSLLQRPNGSQYPVVTFSVFYRGERLVQFGIRPNVP